VAQRHARCQEPPNIGPTNLQVSKQGEGEEQDEEPTKALGLTIPQAVLLQAEQVISEAIGGSLWKAGGGFVMVPLGESPKPTLGIAVEAAGSHARPSRGA